MMTSKFQFFSIIFLLLLTACGTTSQPTEAIPFSVTIPSTLLVTTSVPQDSVDVPNSTAQNLVTPTINAIVTYPLLKTTMGDFIIVLARLVDGAHENKALDGHKFLLIGLAQSDLHKLVAGEFSFEDFQSMTSNGDGEIYILGSDGSKTDYRRMGGWLDNNESVADDFVMGFLVPVTESYTLYWINNLPVTLTIEK